MKLIFCPKCHDIFNLTLNEKICSCGESRGNYLEDRRTVEVTENSIVFCLQNKSFISALSLTQYDDEFGHNMISWILPKNNRWRINK